MPNAEPSADQLAKALDRPLSEFFDGYVVVGYLVTSHNRAVVFKTGGDKVLEDALRPFMEEARAWANPETYDE